MQLSPWYGDTPIIELDGDPAAISEPTIRQRRRLIDVLAGFDDARWAHPSRCEGWSNRDVVTHLQSTNQFWGFSIALGLKGEPSQFLATFDPVATPAQLVADAPPVSNAELLDQFRASTEGLAAQLEGLDEAGWRTTAEAPCGHVSISTLAHHALWDSLIHERDILLPLGVDPVAEPDETLASLRYVAALSPAFAVSRGESPGGILAVDPTDLDAAFRAEAADHVAIRTGPASTAPDLALTGPAVDLLEALSLRAPLDQPVPDAASWFVDGLKVTFDQAPT
ncbi:MAG TPA: maleylpyruvate isomerase family mycothiol-dependent enzyme [Acidimicrobiales bacterium]|nr:maleylpyruvate isomerase family mycothiol-dependent enzyme [Acidimicrobiales bacterium]